MITAENQVTQLYVVNDSTKFSAHKGADGALYFGAVDADGNPVRTDLVTNLLHAKAVSATALRRKPRTYLLTTTDADVVAGEDYVVTVLYRGFISQSDENTYEELGCARATATGSGSAALIVALAKSLVVNTAKQAMVGISLYGTYTDSQGTSATKSVEMPVAIPAFVDSASYSAGDIVESSGVVYRFHSTHVATTAIASEADVVTIKGLIVRELEQSWTLGLHQEEPVRFRLEATKIVKNAVEAEWATIDDVTASQTAYFPNGKYTADLEWFLAGERGDIYRGGGWPVIVPTKYMADATKEYDYINIHHAFVGENHDVQKSEKDIVLVMPVDPNGASAALKHAVGNAVLSAINTAYGSTLLTKPTDW